jgi:hypothetical protein
MLLSPAIGLSADVLVPSVDKRFTGPRSDETPDFQRHVLPLLGRLGCNGRECHGSFQGQGGFRLSLFGYDFAADHEALLADGRKRVDRDDPASSLILKKPTMLVDHEGGERFKADGWEYRLLRRWIDAGAPSVKADGESLVSLEIEPAEIVFDAAGRTAPLKAYARWSDGSREDVTPLCRFRSNDESIATIGESGVVTAAGKGDTHVVVFYDNGITPVPIILPVSESSGPRYPAVPTLTKIDEFVVQKLRKVGVVPSELCTDAEFLRRVSLDMTGTLPMPVEINAFLSDESSGKRQQKIDELLGRPTYSAWLTTRLCDLLGNSEQNLPIGGEQGVRREKSAQWYDWIYRRVGENVPYDRIVEGIVLATSRRPGQSVDEYFVETSSYFRAKDPADFAARETMPYFWTRGRFTPPQPLRFSYAFLGIRLECAQCHKHPYDQWTKEDHVGFQAFFDGVGDNYGDRKIAQDMKQSLGLTADQDSGAYKKLFAQLAAEGQTVPWQEVTVASLARRLERARRTAKVTGGRVFTPKLLGGDEVLAAEFDDSRAPLMQWLRQPDNPYFARALVNRVWTNFFGVGIVDPPDDMNLANPPSNEPLLNYLAGQFIAHGYDLKWLHREIATSRTYQLSWRPNRTNALDERNFSRALVRRLPAEAAYDALVHATAADESMRSLHNDPQVVRARAIGVSSGYDRRDNSYATNLFGKPARTGICDCDRSNEPSLLQTIFLRNDAEMLALFDRKDGWLKQVARNRDARQASNQDELIREAYLRSFSRPPTSDEVAVAREHLQQASSPAPGERDLLWALLNSKEFLLNH